jgi:hypothetical protein
MVHIGDLVQLRGGERNTTYTGIVIRIFDRHEQQYLLIRNLRGVLMGIPAAKCETLPPSHPLSIGPLSLN